MQENPLDAKTIQGVWNIITASQADIHFHFRNGRVWMRLQDIYECLFFGGIEFDHISLFYCVASS